MKFDVDDQLRAAERSATSLERDGQLARAVTLVRSYPTTIENLWDAITNTERLPRWFLPISGELQPGGRYQLEGNAGGVITGCRTPTHLAITWEFGGDVSWVEMRLSRDDTGGARLALTHTALDSEHWAEYGPGMTGVGWELATLGLSLYLAQPTAPKPDEASFVASRDGEAFIAGSSEGWRRVAVASGTDSDAARVAADRTAAFYTGESI